MTPTIIAIPRVSSSCLLTVQETLQDQQVGVTQVSALGPGVCEICVQHLRVESLFPIGIWVF